MRFFFSKCFIPESCADLAARRPSDSVTTISDSLRELNGLVEKRAGEKIVVKIMWDRGSPKQLAKFVVVIYCVDTRLIH